MTPEDNVSKYLENAAEHLRVVHALIIVTCFGLLATGSLARRPDADRAHAQLQMIMRTAVLWRTDDLWLDRYASRIVAAEKLAPPPHTERALNSVEIPHCSRSFFHSGGFKCHRHKAASRRWTLRDASTKAFEATPSDPAHQEVIAPWVELHLAAPRTIREFREVWSHLNRAFPVYVPSTVADFHVDVEKLALLSNIPKVSSNSPIWIDMVLAPYSSDIRDTTDKQRLEPFTHAFQEPLARAANAYAYGAVLPVQVRPVRYINGQQAFNDTFTAGFSIHDQQEFETLAELSKYYADLPFEKAEPILRAERSRSDAAFELLGAKIPVTDLALFGIPVVLMLQLYFMFSVSAFIHALHRSRTVPPVSWLALLPSGAAQAIMQLSVALPGAIVSALAWWAIRQSNSGAMVTVGTAFVGGSVVVAAVTARDCFRLWKLARACE